MADLRRSQEAGVVERLLLEESCLLHQGLLVLQLLQPLLLHLSGSNVEEKSNQHPRERCGIRA